MDLTEQIKKKTLATFHSTEWRIAIHISGQITIIPKPECFGDFGDIPLLFTTI